MAKKILLIGAGPTVIGQGMEFDYSASEAISAYQDAGYEVHVINSNPASLTLDLADRSYLLPLDVVSILSLLEKENYCGIAHLFGGQTALNLAVELFKNKSFQNLNVPFLGSSIQSIEAAENRETFKEIVESLGYAVPMSWVVHSEDPLPKSLAYPLILRPAYTLGGQGGGKVMTEQALKEKLPRAFEASAIQQCLLEEDLSGQTELEFEIVIDQSGESECVLSMENIDPVGIHTGDSMVVAPIQSLSAKKVVVLEKLAQNIAKACGVVGSCNVQMAYHRQKDSVSVIEMNPRVSRSSALASKISHYPIAYVTAELSLGKSLSSLSHPLLKDETSMKQNKHYPAFKAPLWPFDLMPEAKRELGTQMKSFGEALGVSNHLEGAMFQVYQSYPQQDFSKRDDESLLEALTVPSDQRFLIIMELLKRGISIDKLAQKSQILPYFLRKMKASLSFSFEDFSFASSDQSGRMIPMNWKTDAEKLSSRPKRILFVAPGPCKIGQGMEFDYALMKAVLHAKKRGYECFVLNNNPASISTDDRLADKVFWGAIHIENIERIAEKNPFDFIVLQFGGQNALEMLGELEQRGYPVLGSDFSTTHQAEDRELFVENLKSLGLPYVESTYVKNKKEALAIADSIHFPVIFRPSYVLAGQDMALLEKKEDYLQKVKESHAYPVLIESYLAGKEYDFDAVYDGERLYHLGPVEHIEASGVHSGDSTLLYPSVTLTKKQKEKMEAMVLKLAKRLEIKGFMNLQMIVKDDEIYVIEINPRASRTLPFLDRASGQSLIEKGMDVLLGIENQASFNASNDAYSLKLSSFSFERLEGVDVGLGPSMKSTGEWMLQDRSLDKLFEKAFLAKGLDFQKKKIFLMMDDLSELETQARKWRKLSYQVETWPNDSKLFPAAMKQLKKEAYCFVFIEGKNSKTLRRYAYDQKQPLCYRKERMDILYQVIKKKVIACK